MDTHGNDHNKLHFYRTFKGSFTKEPYISAINNRNQRCWLTRLRISACSSLGVEVGRWSSPPTPYSERTCMYCSTENMGSGDTPVDTELHMLLQCSSTALKQQCFLARLASLIPSTVSLTREQLARVILCPATIEHAKLSNKYINILCRLRELMDEGVPSDQLGFRPPSNTADVDNFSMSSSLSDSLESINSVTLNDSFLHRYFYCHIIILYECHCTTEYYYNEYLARNKLP